MARLSWSDRLQDHYDRQMVRMFDDLDARLRIAQRGAKLSELARLERLKQQAEAQIDLPLSLPEQQQQQPDPAPSGKRRSPEEHLPAPATRAAVQALTAFMDSGAQFNERMSAREFAKAAATYASSLGLPGSDSLNTEGSVIRAFAGDILQAVRIAREAARKP